MHCLCRLSLFGAKICA